jgi:hypothetical protein
MTRSTLTALPAVLLAASLAPAQAPLPGPRAEPLPPPAPAAAAPAAPAALAPPVAAQSGPVLTCDSGDARSSGERVWFDAEYLLWWMRGQSLPPLVTTSPAGTAMSQAGVIGQGGTTVLFGDSSSNTGARSGVRLTAGAWVDDGQIFGLEASFLALETKATHFAASSNGSTILARPFIDAASGNQAAIRVAFPGELSGSIKADSTTTGLIGAGFLFRDNIVCGPNYRVAVLGGYRYFRFQDRLDVTSDETSLSPNNPNFVVPGTRIVAGDHFASRNDFNGIDFGVAADFRRGPMSLNLVFNLIPGFNQQDADIHGGTTVAVPGTAPVASTGGVLALPTNIGHFSRGNEVSVIPEFEAKVGYQVTPRLRATLGYTVLYWDNVVRAADQVDRLINPNLLPGASGTGGPSNPMFRFHRDNLWVQGLELGMEFRF